MPTLISRRRGIAVFAAVLALLTAGCARMLLSKGFTPLEGTSTGLPLAAPVEVLRDASGIPHLVAGSERDLIVAQGYIHAQDRLWQMETHRRVASGRLAEIVGPRALDLDHWARLAGLSRLRAQLAARLGEQERALAQAYVDGVNAFIKAHRGDLPLEFRSVKLVPEPWTVEDVMTSVVLNSWFLETNFRQELLILATLPKLSAAEWKDALPAWPGITLPDDAYFDGLRGLRVGPLVKGATAFYEASPIARGLAARGLSARGSGSNNWVIARARDGKPMLSNDPHLGVSVPGVWYFADLRAPGLHVAGASFPGSPGIVIGHNERVAWGFTNVMTDISDLYVLRLDPKDRGRYIVGDRSLPLESEEMVFGLPGGKSETRVATRTIYGPVVTEITPDCDAVAALRWYGTVDGGALADGTLAGMMALNRARSVAEAMEAGRGLRVVGQNIVAGDVDGNIGWHASGAVPLRTGYSGRLPADGSSGTADWTGYLPYESMPQEYNPPRGWIATANHRSVTDDSPSPISYAFCSPDRYDRISELLSAMKDPTPNDFRSIQSDVRSRAADRVIPKVAALGIEEPTAKRALDLMTAWDRNVTADSAGAAVFEVFLSRLDRAILGDELGDAMPLYLNLSYDSYLVYDVLFDRPGSALWDVRGTAARETPREVTEAALAETMAFLEQRLGKDPANWAWGKLHVYDFAHPGATTAIEHRLLSRGPFPAPGDNNTVNVACFDPSKDGFTVQIVPSLRMIAPLSDLDKTTIVGALGQSGQPGREHYDDLIVPWLKNEPVPLHFAEESVRRATVQRLVLAP